MAVEGSVETGEDVRVGLGDSVGLEAMRQATATASTPRARSASRNRSFNFIWRDRAANDSPTPLHVANPTATMNKAGMDRAPSANPVTADPHVATRTATTAWPMAEEPPCAA